MGLAHERFGSAGFAIAEDIYDAGLVNNNGLLMGFTDEAYPQAIGFGADTSNLIIGAAGSGKQTTTITYQLLHPENTVVLDPKGESAAQICPMIPDYDAYCFNPYHLHTGKPWYLATNVKFNPLDIIKKGSRSFHEDCTVIAANLIEKPPEGGGGNAKHFYGKASQILTAVLITLKEHNDEASLVDVYEVINSFRTDEFKYLHFPVMSNSSYAAARQAAEEIAAKEGLSSNEFDSILSTISNALQILASPAMQEVISGPSSITPQDFCKSKRINKLFLMIPAEYLEQCAPVIRCIITSLTIAQQRAAKYRLNILLDEAGQLGAFEALPRLYSFGRGAKIRVTSVYQNFGQGYQYYGKNGFDTIFANSQSKIILSVPSRLSADVVSQHLGNTTYQYTPKSKHANGYAKQEKLMRQALSGGDIFQALPEIIKEQELMDVPDAVQRPLMTADELINLHPDKGLLIFQGLGVKPYIFKKYPYFLNPAMAHRLLPNPFHAPYDSMKLPLIDGGFKTAPIVSEPVPKALAHLPQYSQGMWSYPKGYKPYKPSLFQRLRGKA